MFEFYCRGSAVALSIAYLSMVLVLLVYLAISGIYKETWDGKYIIHYMLYFCQYMEFTRKHGMVSALYIIYYTFASIWNLQGNMGW